MDFVKVMWIANGVIWGAVVVGFIGLVLFNRARNRKRKDEDDG